MDSELHPDVRPGTSAIVPAQWTALGTHRWRYIAPILSIELHGEFRARDFNEYVEKYTLLYRQERNFGLLADATHLVGGASAEIRRRVLKELPNDGPAIPIALLGASLPIRTVLTLLSNARRLLFRDEPAFAFFAKEADATSWLRQRVADRALKSERATTR